MTRPHTSSQPAAPQARPATAARLLEVDGLTVDYGGVRAVRGVSFQVEAGEAIAILGANGAGKTSILKAISGLVDHGGSVAVDGETVTGHKPEDIARLGVAHVPDDRGIFDDLTVEENLRTALFGAGLHRNEEGRTAVAEMLELFPILADRRDQVAGTMSGGQQQMLTIARALAQRPRLVMIDEMSMGLAPSIVEDLFTTVGRLTDRGLGVVLVEQFVDQALAVVDRALVMAGGRVVAQGTAEEMAGSDVAAHYLGGGDTDEISPESGGGAIPLPVSETVGVPVDARQIRRLEKLAREQGKDPDMLAAMALNRYLDTDGRSPVDAEASGGNEGDAI